MSNDSTNFLVAMIDTEFNMYKQIDGEPQFIERIAEHVKRLEEISDTHHFYIDETAFNALKQKGFSLRFTRVFAHNPDTIKRSNEYKVHDMKQLSEIIDTKNRFMPKCQIFFIGSSDFLLHCSKWSKKLLLTVVNRQYDQSTIVDKFPIDEMRSIFRKRNPIQPELLEQIKLYKKMKVKQMVQKRETVITDNGMILTQDVQLPEVIDTSDDIMNTPDYMFYEYRK